MTNSATRSAGSRPPPKSSAGPRGARAQSHQLIDAGATKPARSGKGFVRVYRHGLGDCILVGVKRPDKDDFHLMIDCGVVIGSDSKKLCAAVEDIIAVTGCSLDAVAVTHEHWDHVSGFLQAKDSFEKIQGKVKEVWMAWTENPEDQLAKQVKDEMGKAARALQACAMRLGAASPQTHMLEDIAVTGLLGAASRQTTSAALEAARGLGDGRYLKPGDKPIEIEGANARVYVLGPPRDTKKLRKINPTKSALETYALAMNGAGVFPMGVATALFAEEGDVSGNPFHERVTISEAEAQKIPFFQHYYYKSPEDWRRIDGDWLGPASDLALALQSYTNNTSLVLAIEIGDAGHGEVLLFAADAQVGNWLSWQDYAWQETTATDLLKRTVFYKVGHHGSHNATLKVKGLEKMQDLRAAIIPVDKEVAVKKRWGHMPLPELIEALKSHIKAHTGNDDVFCTDDVMARSSHQVFVDDAYMEFRF